MQPLTVSRPASSLACVVLILLLLPSGARAKVTQRQECKRERRLVVLLEKLREPYYYAEMYGADADSAMVGTLIIKARDRSRWGPDSFGSKGFIWFCQNLRTSENWSLHQGAREVSVWTEAPGDEADQRTLAFPQAGPGAAPAQPPKRAADAGSVGYLVLASKADAQIGIDGKMTARHTPVSPANPIALPAGPHEIKLVDSNGRTEEFPVNIEEGKTVRR